MYTKALLGVLFVLVRLCVTDSRICNDIEIKGSNLSHFSLKLSGCTAIAGYLSIAVVENVNETEFARLQFPALREVRGFFLMYRVSGLQSIGSLFPNLAVIRGNNLVLDYSFIINNVNSLLEIGLEKLQTIEKGYVRIENCPRLCHYQYLEHIVGESRFTSLTRNNGQCDCDNKVCPESCIHDGKCFERRTDCHEECLGCSGPRPDQCFACKNVRSENECVSKCPTKPVKKYINKYLGKCITAEECLNLPKIAKVPNRKWFLYGDSCTETCPPNHANVTEEEGFCKPCGKKCKKYCNIQKVEDLQSLYQFKGCTHINGSFELRNINGAEIANKLAEYLQDIEEIDGYLTIERSPALTSLAFLPNLRVIKGNNLIRGCALSVFENENLRELWNWTDTNNVLKIEKGNFSFYGNRQLCHSDIINFAKMMGVKDVDIQHVSGNKENCVIQNIDVELIHISPTQVMISWKNITQSKDGVEGYLLYYSEAPHKNLTGYYKSDMCDTTIWKIEFLTENAINITKLRPYTQYAYYIIVMAKEKSAGGQTDYQYFRTLSSNPTEPLNIIVSSNSSESIFLKWNPPLSPNGVLSHYTLVWLTEKDDHKFLDQRNYCKNPQTDSITTIIDFIPKPVNKVSCPVYCKEKEEKENIELKFMSLCDKVYKINQTEDDCCKSFSFNVINKPQNMSKILDANLSEYYITGLKPFTMYVVYIQACNKNRTHEAQCSNVVMTWQRTLKSENADDLSRAVSINRKSDGVGLVWSEPMNINGIILSYVIEYRRADIENSKWQKTCVTRKNFKGEYVMNNFPPGRYEVHVKAISLAGPSKFTRQYSFEIPDQSESYQTIVIILIVLFFIGVMAAVAFAYFYKKKHHHEDLLIRDINPDYAGPIYIEDEWEIERKNVEILGELGHGTFGMVYSGILQPRGIECAIKTINEHDHFSNKMEFLNEAAVMKSFNDSHHVVKLLGVVSRGNPPLVIMELMARGDLKSFLRKSRESSQNITCNEMFRMAAEIADGMAYLCGKKFVHRDLAARNCMVAADHTVKIGDFGMARDVYENDYYRKETRGLLPVRWMSPESLADGVFTSDSDVWSYGIVLWEMVTLAEQPYQGLANEQVLQFVVSHGTLQRPNECPDLLWNIMESCWRWRPSNRPMFIHIVEKLASHVGPDFRLVSYYHSKTEEELRVMAKERAVNAPALSLGHKDKEQFMQWKQTEEDKESSFYGEVSRPAPEFLPFSYQRHKPSSSNFLDDQMDDDFSTH